MPENKKHHYVPKFYLRRFSRDKKSICLYNLPKQLNVANANLRNQCYQDYFYGKEKSTESALSGMEGEIAQLYSLIDKYNSFPPPLSEHHVAMVMSILIQYGRTKYQADAFDEMHDKMFKHTFKEKIESELKGVNLDDYIVGIKDVAQYSLGLLTQYYPLLLDLGYKLLVNKTGVEFITSDNPVVMYNQLLSFRKMGSNTGLSCKGLLIFFPLSPDKLIIMYDDNVYRVGGEKKSVVEVTSEKDLYSLNALQACSCYENVYFMSPNQNVAALHRKVKPFLRENKSNIKVFPGPREGNRRSEYIMNYREDIRFNLNLSFLSLRKSAKEWRSSFQKLRMQPAAVLRNETYHNDVEEFVESVKKGAYRGDEFVGFMNKKYVSSRGHR
jgi:hypothetical protein